MAKHQIPEHLVTEHLAGRDRAKTQSHRITRLARRVQQDHQEDETPMRIIAGRHRGTKLALPAGTGTRPTADRTRESLFNILAGGRFGAVVDGTVIILSLIHI